MSDPSQKPSRHAEGPKPKEKVKQEKHLKQRQTDYLDSRDIVEDRKVFGMISIDETI